MGQLFANFWMVLLGWPKSSFGFLCKNKRHIFSFSSRTLLNNVFTALLHYLLPFFRQLPNSIFPKLLTFLNKELFQVPITVFQETEIFSIKKFCKDQNKWTSNAMCTGHPVQCLVNMLDEPDLPSQKHVLLHYPNGRLCFLCLILDAFCQVLLSVGLTGSNTCWN